LLVLQNTGHLFLQFSSALKIIMCTWYCSMC